MIFVILGSQKNQFNRLLKAIDQQIAENQIKDKVYAQIGYSGYVPENFSYKKFMSQEELSREVDGADIIISHGGTGSIMGSLKKGKDIIAVPRRAEFGEHNDNHQIQMVSELAKNRLISYCADPRELYKYIDEIKECRIRNKIPYISNTQGYIDDIEQFIKENV